MKIIPQLLTEIIGDIKFDAKAQGKGTVNGGIHTTGDFNINPMKLDVTPTGKLRVAVPKLQINCSQIKVLTEVWIPIIGWCNAAKITASPFGISTNPATISCDLDGTKVHAETGETTGHMELQSDIKKPGIQLNGDGDIKGKMLVDPPQ